MVFQDIYETESSEGSYEQYTTVVGPASFGRVGESVTIPRVSIVEGFPVYIANFKMATELAMSNESIDDNRHIKNILKSWSQGLGEAARIKQEDEHADIFNYGGFTAGHATFLNDVNAVLTTPYGNLVYDSKPFLNLTGNTRTAKNGSTYYNGVSALDLNEANLQTIFNLLTVTNAFDEAGKRIEIMPDTLLCKYGSTTWWTAKRILESSGSQDAVHSGIKNLWQGKLTLIGWSALTDSDAWFMGCAKKGLKSLARLPLSIDFYEDKGADGQVVRSRIRYGRGVNNFRYWAGANFSGS